MNIVPMNMNVLVSVCTHTFISLGVKLLGQGMLNVVRYCQTDFQSGCTILRLHFHKG